AAGHQVVLVAAVAGALAVHVVLVQLDGRAPGDAGRPDGRLLHDPLPGLVPDDRIPGVGGFRSRVLGVRVVDVQPRSVGQDDVGRSQVVTVGAVALLRAVAQVETTRVPQRGLDLVVPASTPRPRDLGR